MWNCIYCIEGLENSILTLTHFNFGIIKTKISIISLPVTLTDSYWKIKLFPRVKRIKLENIHPKWQRNQESVVQRKLFRILLLSVGLATRKKQMQIQYLRPVPMDSTPHQIFGSSIPLLPKVHVAWGPQNYPLNQRRTWLYKRASVMISSSQGLATAAPAA